MYRWLFINGYYNGEEVRIYPWSEEERGIGFFHCLFSLMKAIAATGDEVTYLGYIKAENEGIYNGIQWYNFPDNGHTEVLRKANEVGFDAAVSVEVWDDLYLTFPNCRHRIAYSHNQNYGGHYLTKLQSPDTTDIVAVSGFHKEILETNYPELAPKISVIGNGLDKSLCRETPTRDMNSLLFAAGPHKGLVGVYPIWDQLHKRHPNLTLKVSSSSTLYGFNEWDEEKRWKSRLLSLPRVEDIGVLPHRQFIQELGKAGIYIYPCPIPDTFGLSVLEAQAMGTPVISYNVGGYCPALLRAYGGIGIKPPSPDLFADAVTEVLTKPDLYNLMSASRDKVLGDTSLDWSTIADQWRKVVA